MTNRCDMSGCCSLPTERVGCASRAVDSCSMRLVPNYRIIFGRNLRGWTGAVLSRLKGYGAARWVLRELAVARVIALSGVVRGGCVYCRCG